MSAKLVAEVEALYETPGQLCGVDPRVFSLGYRASRAVLPN